MPRLTPKNLSNSPDTAESLRKQLQQVLSQDPVDLGKVLSLSNRLAEHDASYVRFSVDAGLINRLGRELVARPETAVTELIKNAYDADATEVSLTFENCDEPGGQLTISDNGTGMTRQELIHGFMRLSSTDKVSEPISPRFNRQRAGRKGIGRFAVQRLGTQLEIITQTLADERALRVVIDWEQFVAGTDLNHVVSRIEEVEKQGDEGTTLRIQGLREAWLETALRRVYRSVADLIQPVMLRENRPVRSGSSPHSETEARLGKQGTDFQVTLRRNDGQSDVVVDETSEVLQYALAVIEGFVDESGQGYWSFKSEKLGLDEKILLMGSDRERHNVPFPTLRNVDFKAHYFIVLPDLIPRSVNKTIRELLAERGGIRLYRNGYRVSPYGEKGDDWLRLDESTRGRWILPPHANINFLGFVELVDTKGSQFEETASREGLLENEALKELRDFVYRVLGAAVSRIAEARNRKVTASQRQWERKPSTAQRLRETVKNLKAAAQQQEESEKDPQRNGQRLPDEPTQPSQNEGVTSGFLSNLADDLEVAAQEHEAEEQAKLEEIGMLRVLSSLGLVIGEFTHEVSQTLGAAVLNARQLTRQFPSNQHGHGLQAAQLLHNLERFDSYVSYFDQAVLDKVQRELVPQDLHEIIGKWLKLVEPSAERLNIDLKEPVLEDETLLSCPMHVSEWASVLFNFYSNAAKAIRRAGSQGAIQIVGGREKGYIFIEFSDNGDGVPPANSDRIFDAFFTTSTPASADVDEYEALKGSGLGLKIVRDIAESYGGRVQLVDAPVGYTTCFRIEFPEATEELKETYGY